MSVTALLIDDSPAARQVIAYYLRRSGCTVVAEADNARQGLELFRRHRPNVVTLDVMMPKVFNIDSAALLTTIKREISQVVVIVVSVLPFQRTREEFLAQGVTAYLVKPLHDLSFAPVHEMLLHAFPELKAASPSKTD
jgi:two-component system, chemotaxis family, chemotaxis protein CheY